MTNPETSTATAPQALISPYYLHPTDNTGHVQTPVLLNGANYERWSKLLSNAMRSKRKLGFLDGSLKRPVGETEDAERWDMVNSMIIGWMFASVEEKLRSSISLMDKASTMWSSIRRRFGVNDGTKEHQLHADLTKCKQEEDTIEEYFARLKLLWDAIEEGDSGFVCFCGEDNCKAMKKYHAKQEQMQIHQFLMGLSGSKFGTTRSNLLARIKDETLDTVYSQIIQEERHHNATQAEQEKPSIALAVSADSSLSKQSLTCTHCNRTGHEKSGCFKLIGYPEWYEQNSSLNTSRNSRGRGRTKSNRGRGSSQPRANVVDGSAGIPCVTPTQWSHLAEFIDARKSSSSDKLTGNTEKLILYRINSKYDLIIDSGASHHMTGDINLLSDLTKIAPCPIKLPNNGVAWATRHGTLSLGGKLFLHHVYYAPDLSITLISVAQLLRDFASVVVFTKRFCVIQDQASKTLIGAGEERDGFIILLVQLFLKPIVSAELITETYGIVEWVIRLQKF